MKIRYYYFHLLRRLINNQPPPPPPKKTDGFFGPQPLPYVSHRVESSELAIKDDSYSGKE